MILQRLRFTLAIAVGLLVISCGGDADYAERADRLSQQLILVDTHVDLPYRLTNHWEDVSQRTEEGDFDYPRSVEGGLDAPFMSIYIPAEYQQTGGARQLADSLIDMVGRLANEHPSKFALADSPEEIRNNFNNGLISLPMGIENGAALEGELENIRYFYERGIRYITLTHAEDNRISDSSYDTTDTHNGLSDFGIDVVREMNETGMMVDVSHLSDSAFYDVMRVTEAPAIASHSSCRHFTPGWERNMSDAMIQTLAENGGVIMINFGSDFLDQKSLESGQKLRDETSDWMEEQNLDISDSKAREYVRSYFEEHYEFTDVAKVADHFDHVVELVGIDHVGLGSDFDGVGNTLPVGLKDASDYPNLIAELLKRGYTEEELEKICSGNIFRVWNRVIDRARELQDETE